MRFADAWAIKQTASVIAEAVHFHCLKAALTPVSAAPRSLRCASMVNRDPDIRDEAESRTVPSSGIGAAAGADRLGGAQTPAWPVLVCRISQHADIHVVYLRYGVI